MFSAGGFGPERAGCGSPELDKSVSYNGPASGTKWPFGNVAAGEVHPQPHIISFGKGKKMLFTGRTHYKLK